MWWTWTRGPDEAWLVVDQLVEAGVRALMGAGDVR